MNNKRLDQKLASIHADPSGSKEFIIADAKDADMAFGMKAPGPRLNGDRPPGAHFPRPWRTLPEYLQQIRTIIDQDIVDIMLLSVSNLEQLGIKERLFERSKITPAARANDTSDIWVVRGGTYLDAPSLPFCSANLDHIMHGELASYRRRECSGADLGLYSITFTNNAERDHRTLRTFRDFRLNAEEKKFRYFLEVFNPNVESGIAPDKIGDFLNDHIVRTLAAVPEAGRPLFLKIPYNGPRAVEELAMYDPHLVVGILGGSAGTTHDAFQMIADAKKYGARVALYGRKINQAEHQLAFIEYLRAVVDGKIAPREAVKAYHGRLQNEKLQPVRSLEDDLQITDQNMSYK
jgi:hypothetical protein